MIRLSPVEFDAAGGADLRGDAGVGAGGGRSGAPEEATRGPRAEATGGPRRVPRSDPCWASHLPFRPAKIVVQRWWADDGQPRHHRGLSAGERTSACGEAPEASAPEPVEAAAPESSAAREAPAPLPAVAALSDPSGPVPALLSDLPGPVGAALAALLAAAGPGGLTGVDGAAGVGANTALGVVEASETVQAWAASVGSGATRVLHQVFRSELLSEAEQADASKTRRERAEAEVRDTTCAELEAATGLGAHEVRRRVGFALAPPAATATVNSLLGSGGTSYLRARTVVEETAALPAGVADQIAADVLGPRRDGAPKSQAQFRARLRTLIRRHLGPTEAARVEHEQAVAARRAQAQLFDNGTGELSIGGEAARVAAAMGRVDRIARRFRATGDPRTLDQLRSDVALDLLLYGWVPPRPTSRGRRPGGTATGTAPGAATTTAESGPPGSGPASSRGGHPPGGGPDHDPHDAPDHDPTDAPDHDPTDAPDHDPTDTADHEPDDVTDDHPDDLHEHDPAASAGPDGDRDAHRDQDWGADPRNGRGEPADDRRDEDSDEGSGEDPMGAYRVLGESPTARVDLVVALTTLLGLDDGVGQLPGHGPVSAAQARQIALSLGAVWTRVVTDPVTGHAVERSVNRYRFDPAMTAQAKTRDGTCRAPGCTVPAERCDRDHVREYATDDAGTPVGGPTSAANQAALHRRHHNLKTRGHWTTAIHHDGTMTWTTAAGRTYTTDPMDYHAWTATTPTQPTDTNQPTHPTPRTDATPDDHPTPPTPDSPATAGDGRVSRDDGRASRDGGRVSWDGEDLPIINRGSGHQSAPEAPTAAATKSPYDGPPPF